MGADGVRQSSFPPKTGRTWRPLPKCRGAMEEDSGALLGRWMEDLRQTPSLLPLQPIPRPSKPRYSSSRLRSRHRRRMGVLRVACGMVQVLNALDAGDCKPQTRAARRLNDRSPLDPAAMRTRNMCLREAQDLERRRREFEAPTGVQALASVLKTSQVEQYSVRATSDSPHVPLRSGDIDEPSDDWCVSMLEVLPTEDADYYSAEDHVVNLEAKSSAEFIEVEETYAFVNGSLSEYVSYLQRSDLPAGMWVFKCASEVKAFCGFSTVPKKDPLWLRKLLMACATNFHGMTPARESY